MTRVAVTVRTKTFYTRTKIRKLAAAGNDAELIEATRTGFSTCSNSTARSDCWASASNSQCPSSRTVHRRGHQAADDLFVTMTDALGINRTG